MNEIVYIAQYDDHIIGVFDSLEKGIMACDEDADGSCFAELTWEGDSKETWASVFNEGETWSRHTYTVTGHGVE